MQQVQEVKRARGVRFPCFALSGPSSLSANAEQGERRLLVGLLDPTLPLPARQPSPTHPEPSHSAFARCQPRAKTRTREIRSFVVSYARRARALSRSTSCATILHGLPLSPPPSLLHLCFHSPYSSRSIWSCIHCHSRRAGGALRALLN